MNKKNPPLFVIWMFGLILCAMLEVPVWAMAFGSVLFGLLVMLVRRYWTALWLGYFAHGIWNDPEKALKLYDFGYGGGGRAAAPMIAYAMLLMEQYRYDKALAVLWEVQNRTDMNHTMRLVSRQDLAIAMEKTGDVSSALLEMEKIQQEYECLGSNFYSTLAYFYIQAGEYEKAAAANEQSGKEEPNGAYYDNLALIAYRQGDYAQAKVLFEKALEMDDSIISPRFYLGVLAEQQGDTDTAAEYFREVYESGVTGLSTISREEVQKKYGLYC